jgi:hypothetical protein
LRLTRNCPWNKCTFCTSYKGTHFGKRTPGEILADIETVHNIASELNNISGNIGQVTSTGKPSFDSVISKFMQEHRLLFDVNSAGHELVNQRWQCLSIVWSWLMSGAKTVFLQDADSLVMPTAQIVDILGVLRKHFPSVERITSYARAVTVSRHSLTDLKALKLAGLSRLHLGLESGSDEVLAHVQKGLTAQVQIDAGILIKQSGISLSEYIIPGLGGVALSVKHAEESVRVLNTVKPDFIRFRSLVTKPGMSLYDEIAPGIFRPATEDQMVDEIRHIVGNLDFGVRITSDHISNLLGEIEGTLPADRQHLLGIIDSYRSLPLSDRQGIQLYRRLNSFRAVTGGLEPELENEAVAALSIIRTGRPLEESALANLLTKLKQVYI